MDSVANPELSEQDMALPKGQDVIAEADLLGWNGNGPLPTRALEQGAWFLFNLDHADWQWDRVTSAVRDDYRLRYMRLRTRILIEERWTLGNMLDKLDAGFTRLVCGDRGPSVRESNLIRDYAESCLQDLFKLLGGDQGDLLAKGVEVASSASYKYVPEHEPDDSEIEVIDQKKKVN